MPTSQAIFRSMCFVCVSNWSFYQVIILDI